MAESVHDIGRAGIGSGERRGGRLTSKLGGYRYRCGGLRTGVVVLVAVMVTGVLLVTLGAAKAPLLEIVPTLADQSHGRIAVPLMGR